MYKTLVLVCYLIFIYLFMYSSFFKKMTSNVLPTVTTVLLYNKNEECMYSQHHNRFLECKSSEDIFVKNLLCKTKRFKIPNTVLIYDTYTILRYHISDYVLYLVTMTKNQNENSKSGSAIEIELQIKDDDNNNNKNNNDNNNDNDNSNNDTISTEIKYMFKKVCEITKKFTKNKDIVKTLKSLFG
jgi:hypothetical protein